MDRRVYLSGRDDPSWSCLDPQSICVVFSILKFNPTSVTSQTSHISRYDKRNYDNKEIVAKRKGVVAGELSQTEDLVT